MLAEERFALILNLLAEKRTATVQELCEALNASESTIRRDLTELARQGRLNKVHGGATLPDGQFLADEPTSALDAATQRTVADELISMRTDGLSQLIVTHDLALAAYIADRIAVMHRGKIVELAPARELLDAPLHSYTKALLKTAPRLGGELPAAAENSEAYSGLLTELSPGHFVLMEVQHGQYTER